MNVLSKLLLKTEISSDFPLLVILVEFLVQFSCFVPAEFNIYCFTPGFNKRSFDVTRRCQPCGLVNYDNNLLISVKLYQQDFLQLISDVKPQSSLVVFLGSNCFSFQIMSCAT